MEGELWRHVPPSFFLIFTNGLSRLGEWRSKSEEDEAEDAQLPDELDIPKDRLATRAFSGTAVGYGHFGQARGIHMRICHRIALKSFNLKISNAQNEIAEEERRLTHLG